MHVSSDTVPPTWNILHGQDSGRCIIPMDELQRKSHYTLLDKNNPDSNTERNMKEEFIEAKETET